MNLYIPLDTLLGSMQAALRRRQNSRSTTGKDSIFSVDDPNNETLPYEILLACFEWLGDHLDLDHFLTRLDEHRPLAQTSLETGNAFWSPRYSFRKEDLLNCTLVCKAWCLPASSLLAITIPDLSRCTTRETGRIHTSSGQGRRETASEKEEGLKLETL